MKSPLMFPARRNLTSFLPRLGLAIALLAGIIPSRLTAQTASTDSAAAAPAVNTTNAPPATAMAVPGATNSGPETPKAESSPKPTSGPAVPGEDIQVSFQGANVDMIVQWLAQNTGKSVIKHPKVQCQLTIVSSKKVSPREALNLVYRALALEGFTALESSDSILIVPEGQEPKLNPLLLDSSKPQIPEGRQKIVKIFPLAYIQATELRDKIRGVLSDKAVIDTDDQANRIIVTDYNDNLRLVAEMIKELDVAAADLTIEIFLIKNASAEELANLVGLVLNGTSGGPAAPAARPSPRSSSGSSSPGGSPSPMGGSSGSSSSSGESSAPTASGSSTGTQIRLWPDRAVNRIIVAAPRAKMPEVQRLITALDTEKTEDVTVRVINLKKASAIDLAREIAPLYQKTAGKSPKDIIEVSADERSNSLIVLSSEANFRILQKLISEFDTEEAQERASKTFSIKNADAEDVAKQLQDLFKEQDTSYSRYVYYLSGSSGRGSRKFSVVADRRRNALVVQAPPSQMENIEQMIAELDQPVASDSLTPRIYPLKYVGAVDIEQVLNELFLKKDTQRSYFDYFYDYMPDSSSSDRNVGRLYGKVRITSEPYANAIIITANSKESLLAVEEVLRQLDRPSEAGESTLRVALKYAKATTVANSINILFAKNGSPPLRQVNPQNQSSGSTPPSQSPATGATRSGFDLEQESKEDGYYPWLGGQTETSRGYDSRSTTTRPVSDLVGRVRAVADQRSNALMISANMHFFAQILKLIEDLDAPTDQVLIEARLVEVSSNFLDKLGVRWSPDGSKVFTTEDYDNSILAHATAQYQKGFNGLTAVNTPSSTTVAQSLASLRSGVLDSTINMDFLVQFLRKTTDATVLAEPQISIRDNETGRLFVGQQVPIPDNTQVSQLGGQNTSFRYKDVGVVLEVTPHINITGDVELKIHAESSTVVPGQTVLGGSLFDTRNFRTDLRAKNGETLILGGIIQKQVSTTIRKVPVLGSIPALGWLFKKKDKTSQEVELMVFLRPKVIRTSIDAKQLIEDLDKKAPLLKEWRESSPLSVDEMKKKKK